VRGIKQQIPPLAYISSLKLLQQISNNKIFFGYGVDFCVFRAFIVRAFKQAKAIRKAIQMSAKGKTFKEFFIDR
jgi:hypothetical protein